MKSIPKLIRRFVGIMFISTLLILILNIASFIIIGSRCTSSISPYTTANEIGESFIKNENGYEIENKELTELINNDVWAMIIDNTTHKVVWNTENFPDNIPLEYSLSAVSDLTLGYIKDYPTYVGDVEDGIIVFGYPKDRYWKSMYPTWDYYFIANLPKTFLIVFSVNILLIFLIYICVTGKMIKSVSPIISAIKSLTEKEKIHVKEKGVFSELAFNLNQTAELLENQERLLLKKETARANWIAGVSHDIRTPLAMIMGYAGQMENSANLSDEERRKASVIVKQSERMKNLINDLNLASKLEYNMQPVHKDKINIISVVRQVTVDFINLDINNKFPVEWLTDDSFTSYMLNGDRELLKRAISNLIQNCINHNENGCTIYVTLEKNEKCRVIISDNGIGASDEQIETLNQSPHYMVCDENVSEQRHGLGLLIVKQIVFAHNGTVDIGHSKYGGFEVIISF